MNRPARNALWLVGCGLLGLGLAYAVFAFGSPIDPWRTRAVWITGVAAVVALATTFGWRCGRPGVRGWLPLAAWLWLLGYAGFMLWNAKARHAIHDFQFHWLEPPLPGAPGTLSVQASAGAPLEILALAFVFAVGWRAARGGGGRWLTPVKWLVGLGVAVSLFGILHKATGAEAVWWLEDRKHPVTFFAPFVYHASAGAFLNLIFPLAIGGGLSVASGEDGRGARWTWFGAALVIGSATLITTSKGAVLLVLASLLLQMFVHRRRLRSLLAEGSSFAGGRRFERALLAAAAAGGVLLVLLIGWDRSLGRFDEWSARLAEEGLAGEGRVVVAGVIASMAAPDAGGLWGYGPGTFPHLFPYFTSHLGSRLEGLWLTGHNDWLQMFVEWGWIGGVAWLVIGFGSLVAGWSALRHRRALSSREAPVLRGTMIGLTITGLHGAFDFPFQIYAVTVTAILMCGFLWGKGIASAPSRE